jgi:hypothetical protein
MKFLLIIQICSTITQQCTDLIKIYPMYNSHFDCATGGFLRGMTIMRELGQEEVNQKKMLMNFTCQELISS